MIDQLNQVLATQFPLTASEIAAKLKVAKKEINQILYTHPEFVMDAKGPPPTWRLRRHQEPRAHIRECVERVTEHMEATGGTPLPSDEAWELLKGLVYAIQEVHDL